MTKVFFVRRYECFARYDEEKDCDINTLDHEIEERPEERPPHTYVEKFNSLEEAQEYVDKWQGKEVDSSIEVNEGSRFFSQRGGWD